MKLVFLFALLVSSYSFAQIVGPAESLNGFNFNAPVVLNADNVDDVVGTIVFDVTNNQFMGLNKDGDWNPMTAPEGNQVVSSNTERVERARVAGSANDSSGCTSNPCTIHRQSGGFASVTRSGSGSYIGNITSGKFSETPSCTCTAVSSAGNTRICISMATSPTSINISTNYFDSTSGTSSSSDSFFDIICVGPY